MEPCHAMHQHMTAHAATQLFFRLRHSQHGPSTVHPRRTGRANFGPAGVHKDCLFVVRIRILRLDAPRTHGHPSREGAIGGVAARFLVRRTPRLCTNLRFCGTRPPLGSDDGDPIAGTTKSERPPHGHDPRALFYIGVAASFRAEDQ